MSGYSSPGERKWGRKTQRYGKQKVEAFLFVLSGQEGGGIRGKYTLLFQPEDREPENDFQWLNSKYYMTF